MDIVSDFYDKYGSREWERLESTAYGRLIFTCHMWFLQDGLINGRRVLDAGCGPGRYSIEAAKAGCDVTMLDISPVQLALAERMMIENGFINVRRYNYIRESVTDMKDVPDNEYDVAICYGAVLNYIRGASAKAMAGLCSKLKKGGTLYISVNSRYGLLRSCASEMKMELRNFWGDPKRWGIYEVMETGEETDYPGAKQPNRHFYTSDEVKALMLEAGLSDIELASAPVMMTGLRTNTEKLSEDRDAWQTLLDAEYRMYRNPALNDAGEFILAKGIKR